MFEEPYEDVPLFYDPVTDVPVEQWVKVMMDWLGVRGWTTVNFSLTREMAKHHGERPPDSPWCWPSYWLASVYSPRQFSNAPPSGLLGTDPQHSVVMLGSKIEWDPHPQREMGHLGFVGADIFLPVDPARLRLVRR